MFGFFNPAKARACLSGFAAERVFAFIVVEALTSRPSASKDTVRHAQDSVFAGAMRLRIGALGRHSMTPRTCFYRGAGVVYYI
jgi:hypothetical protein